MKQKLINPLFLSKRNKVLATKSPVSNEEMIRAYIISCDGKEIPCDVCLEDRVCLPVKRV